MKLIQTISILLLVATSTQASDSPFKLRGIKGLWWEGIEKYQLALPWVADHNENFLMLCYSSFPASGKDWRANYTDKELNDFADLARAAQSRGVELCLSFNPGIWSRPPLTYSDETDFQLALNKIKTLHARGLHSFSLCLDDINQQLQPADQQRFGTLAKAQVHFVNRLWSELKALDPHARLIFCPSAYTTRDAEKHLDYIQTISQIDPAVYMFWTGPVVCSPTITAADARHFASWIKRKPIVWDNYPVNDMFPWRPLLAPVKGRSPDLAGEVEGFMSNPMKQWEASKIPLSTIADYLNDPTHYDPAASLQRALESYPFSQRLTVRNITNLYGSSFLGQPAYPPKPTSRDALLQLQTDLSHMPELSALYQDIKPTLDADLKQPAKRDATP